MRVEILAHTPDLERLISASAKLCYSKTGLDGLMDNNNEQVEKFLNRLIEMGHESPIEHASFTFAVEGISRVCSHQLVRSRIASYSQQSQRYVKLDQFEYIMPPAIRDNQFARLTFVEAMESSQSSYDAIVDELLYGMCYNYLVNSNIYSADCQQWSPSLMFEKTREQSKKRFSAFEKKAIEDARFVFPNACETKIIFTMNARTLMNFFKHRCCNRAQWEIRDMANKMLTLVKEISPTLFKYSGAGCTYGNCPEGKMTCGNPIKIKEE